MKKIVSIFLVLIVCMSMVSSAFAAESATDSIADSVADKNHDVVSSITVMDKNGNDVQYQLKNNTVSTIPIYGYRESDDTDTTRSLGISEVAVLDIWVQYGQANFKFKPTGITLLTTLGFVGNLNTYNGGALYGTNYFGIPVWLGSVSAPSRGNGSLSGTYLVLGYSPIHIYQSFVW